MESGSRPVTGAGREAAGRPPALSQLGISSDAEEKDEGEERSVPRSKPVTPHNLSPRELLPTRSSCSSLGTEAQSIIATGAINEFQMYQRFRLKMVQMFGSLSSALYEFGADPETGCIPRVHFEDVCAQRLGLLCHTEASLLFSHVTNADPLDGGLGGCAYPRHFGISDEEWKQLVLRKKREKDGEGGSMPFSSGPSGTSLGSYHRTIHVGRVNEPQQSPRRDLPDTPGAHASNSASSARATSPLPAAAESSTATARAPGSSGRQQRSTAGSFPWRRPQRPWMRSILAGEDLLSETGSFWKTPRSDQALRFDTSGDASLHIAQPKHHQLGRGERRGPKDMGFLPASCPSRRFEMEPMQCHQQAEVWWPYSSPRPKLRLTTPRRG